VCIAQAATMTVTAQIRQRCGCLPWDRPVGAPSVPRWRPASPPTASQVGIHKRVVWRSRRGPRAPRLHPTPASQRDGRAALKAVQQGQRLHSTLPPHSRGSVAFIARTTHHSATATLDVHHRRRIRLDSPSASAQHRTPGRFQGLRCGRVADTLPARTSHDPGAIRTPTRALVLRNRHSGRHGRGGSPILRRSTGDLTPGQPTGVREERSRDQRGRFTIRPSTSGMRVSGVRAGFSVAIAAVSRRRSGSSNPKVSR